MKPLLEAALEVQRFCEKQKWKFCFIGGLAVQRWAEPRLTRDIDLTLLTGLGDEEMFVDSLLTRFRPRVDRARDFALLRRVLLLETTDGIGIDIALAALPYEEVVIKRSSLYQFLPGIRLRTCSAEDLIVLKAFASRGIDWHDIKMTTVRQGSTNLDWQYILRSLRPLAEAKNQIELIAHLKQVRSEVGKQEKKRK